MVATLSDLPHQKRITLVILKPWVNMGNYNTCKTVGIGLIKLHNHDGSTGILRDVQYVPKLKKNLIS